MCLRAGMGPLDGGLLRGPQQIHGTPHASRRGNGNAAGRTAQYPGGAYRLGGADIAATALLRQQVTAQDDYPCWVSNGDYTFALFPILDVIRAIEKRFPGLAGRVAEFVERDTLPGLERLKDALIAFEDAARAKVSGGVCLEAVRQANWTKIAAVANRLEKDAPVSLQGAAAKIRYEWAFRTGSEPDDGDSAECRLLLSSAEALESAELRKAA